MDFVEDIWIRQKRAEAGFGAEVDLPAAVLDARKIRGIRIAENPSTESDECGDLLRRVR